MSDNVRYVKQNGWECAPEPPPSQTPSQTAGFHQISIPARARRLAPLLILLLSLLPAIARGQGSMSMSYFGEGHFAPALSRSELDVFVRVLKLKDPEVQAMNELYDGYAETVHLEGQQARDSMYETMDEAETYVDPGRLEKVSKDMDAWQKRAEELKRTFVDDLKALLTKEQEQRWPIVERELRRMKLAGGRLIGETADVIRLVQNLKLLTLPAPAEETLEVYSQEFDRLLVQREKFMQDNEGKFNSLVASDPPAAETMYRDAMRIRLAIRDLNERTVKSLAPMLPADSGAKLKEQFEAPMRERIEIKSRAQALLKAAAEIDSLTHEQQAHLDELTRWYSDRLVPWQASMALETRNQEEAELPENLSRALGKEPPTDPNGPYSQWRLPPEHPLAKLRKERFELDKECRRRLLNLLTPEQARSLPPGRENHVQFSSYRPYGL